MSLKDNPASPPLPKATLAALLGNALEYYDITLYGFFAVSLASHYFPSEQPYISLLSSFGAFAAGFLMRPIGGLCFGYFGDKIGRRKVLLSTLLLMSFPTMGVGLLPAYEQWGLLSPVLLILFRLLQGFCAGGEYSGAAIYINEQTFKRKGFAGSLLALSGFGGALIGTGLSAFFTSSLFPEWGWRIPFVLGGAMGALAFIYRRQLPESHAFKKEETQPFSFTILGFLKINGRNLLTTLGIGGAAVIPYYILSIYMNKILIQELQFSLSNLMLLNSLIMILWIILLPLMGYFSDKVGLKKMMLGSSFFTLLVAYPLFSYLYQDLSISRLIAFQIILSVIATAFVAPTSAFLPQLFQIKHRYLGIAFSYSLGAALLGGTTPLIVTYLVERGKNPLWACYYLAFSGLIGLMSVAYSKEKKVL